MAFKKCPTCQNWDVGTHRCPPLFLVWCEDRGETEDDGREIFAADAEDAATEWAERDDYEGADYLIVSQKDEPTVFVKDNRDGEVKKFTVTGEAVPSYRAAEIN